MYLSYVNMLQLERIVNGDMYYGDHAVQRMLGLSNMGNLRNSCAF